MPYKLVWEPAPENKDIPVLETLPEGLNEKPCWGNYKMAETPLEEVISKKIPWIYYYHCHWCKGWIKGRPNEYREDTIGPLSGRRGTAFYCIRCGNEIGFSGMVS